MRIRASQLNGCAYCVDAHCKDALESGGTVQRIFLISNWKETSGIFSEEEQTILKMTEEITLIHVNGVLDDTYSNAIRLLGETKTAELMMCIIAINGWNRIGVATHLTPLIRENE